MTFSTVFKKADQRVRITLVYKIEMKITNSGQTDMVYLDFNKAFDSIPH